MNQAEAPRVAVVLVNWRGWRDTLLALETLFAGDHQHFDTVVVDNASGDDSIEHILAWAEGREAAALPSQLEGRVRVRSSRAPMASVVLHENQLAAAPAPGRLTVIQSARNGGFAAGNNLALRYLLGQGSYDYFWLLNNDAFPAPDALTHLLARAEMDRGIGMVGSTLVFAGRPDTIQAQGGAEYQCARGRGIHVGAETSLAGLARVDEDEIERRLAYIVGASMLVSNRFLAEVGLMEEGYFLYFEEIDWAERGKPNFKLGYAKQSLVYHKAGGSTQAASRRSTLAAYYIARNRMVFTRRFYSKHASSVLRATFVDALRYAVKAHWSEARGFARAAFEALRKANPEGLA